MVQVMSEDAIYNRWHKHASLLPENRCICRRKGGTQTMGRYILEQFPHISDTQRTLGALALVSPRDPSDSDAVPASNVVLFPQLTQLIEGLTPIERHVLTCVAVHRWAYEEPMPYVAPTAHQATIAQKLASAPLYLVQPILVGRRDRAYQLTQRGDLVARRVVRRMPLQTLMQRERTFDRMRALMRNTLDVWKVDDDRDDDLA
jgi:hypothetical protein